MKKSITTICMSLIILILSTGMALAGNGILGRSAAANGGGTGLGVESLPYEYPSDDEIAALTFMVEEEKVARDVYTELYETWSIPAFANIAKAEQKHMDAVISLFDKYGLVNPVDGLLAGEFATQEMKDLYDDLVEAGMEDEIGALFVGATIEDLDIADLIHDLTLVDNEDITVVFSNLLKGSENHLRSFCALLVLYGSSSYEAQYLTQEQVDAILTTTRSTGKNSSAQSGSANQNDRTPQQNLMIDADGDGTCDLLQ